MTKEQALNSFHKKRCCFVVSARLSTQQTQVIIGIARLTIILLVVIILCNLLLNAQSMSQYNLQYRPA